MVANETISFATVLKKPFQPEDFLTHLLSKALKCTGSRLVQNFEKAGYSITKLQWLVMVRCFRAKTDEIILQNDVVEMMMGNKTGVTRAVDELVKQGWVHREIYELDRRNRVLTLTDKGRIIMPELLKCAEVTIAEATVGIPESDLETTRKVLRQITKNNNLFNQSE